MISGHFWILSRIYMINAAWQEMDANLGYAGMRMWSSRNLVLLLKLLLSMTVSFEAVT
jgi:hypothetical protein